MGRWPTVAIVGRPNVGKSSLFNRLLRRRQALVDPTPGVTRDRLEAPVTWRGRTFSLVDTGGLTFEREASVASAVHQQVEAAIQEADLLLWVCDAGRGALPLDARIAARLRQSAKPVVLVANKADTAAVAQQAVELHALGFGPPVPVSSAHGRGIGELLDVVVDRLPAGGAAEDAAPPGMSVAVVGRPNVGKSSIINRLIGQDRVTVDAAPGTTRDAVEVPVVRGGRVARLVDTAGVRPRPKLKTAVDRVSVAQSFRAIEQADGCLLVLDASTGLVADDLTLLGLILKAGRPCVVLLNKWDLVTAGHPDAYARAVWRRAPFAAFLPIVAASAKTGYHLEYAFGVAAEVVARSQRPVPGEVLKAAVRDLHETAHRPGRLRPVRFVRLRQVAQRPLTIELTVHGAVRWRRSDLAFVERVVRSHADLTGIPCRITVRTV